MNSIKEYFERDIRRRCLSISALEREAEMPAKTLAHFLKGRRKLSDKHITKLKTILENFGYKN